MDKQDLLNKIIAFKDSEKKIVYKINPAKCKGCGLCQKNCPANAIEGSPGKVYKIDPEKCIRCGACESVCPFQAIEYLETK